MKASYEWNHLRQMPSKDYVIRVNVLILLLLHILYMKTTPLCVDGLWPCCDRVMVTFPQAICPHSRNSLWLQQSTVVWLEDLWLKSSVKMDPKFKFSVMGGTLLAHLGEVQSYGHNALSAAPRLSTFEWLGSKIWWFHPNIFMFFLGWLWYYAGTAIDHPIVRG